MVEFSCIYNDSDEDCYKCVKHGYIFNCGGCADYDNGRNKKKSKEPNELIAEIKGIIKTHDGNMFQREDGFEAIKKLLGIY